MAAKTEAAGAETELDGEEGAAPKRKLPIKLIAIGAAGFLLVAGGGTAAYKMFSGKKHEEEKAATPVVKPVAFLDLPDVMVNLSTPGQRPRALSQAQDRAGGR
jgi:flagellar protein FliL